MATILIACAQKLNCTLKNLRDFLNHPQDREKALKSLMGREVRTTYEDKNGFKRTFFISGITKQGAHSLRAYGRLPRPFNLSVAQHFYACHRIRLKHPYLQCIIEHFPTGEDHYYPMELLEFVEEKNEENLIIPDMFKEMKTWDFMRWASENHKEESNNDNDDDDDECDEEEVKEDTDESGIFLGARAECSQKKCWQCSNIFQ